MLKIPALIILSFLFSCATPKLFPVDNSKVGVKYKRVRGTIFTDKYSFGSFSLREDIDSTTRWTPTANDVKLVEHLLRKSITKANYKLPKGYGPKVYRHWNAYFRQYIGYRNKEGQKIVFVNALWDRIRLTEVLYNGFEHRMDYKSDYAIVFDGGSDYWSAEINLETKKLTGFGTNGIADAKDIIIDASLSRLWAFSPKPDRMQSNSR